MSEPQEQVALSIITNVIGASTDRNPFVLAESIVEQLLGAGFQIQHVESTTQLPFAPISLVIHEHEWVKVDEVHQGLTQIRTYECRGCLAHTTLTGPMGIRSPFEVEESTDG